MSEEIAMYKDFMNGLLERRVEMRSKFIKTNRKQVWPKVEHYKKYTDFFNTLSAENKLVLADLLQDTRDGAIFDTLEYFDEKIYLAELHVTQRGVEYPRNFFGGDFHMDWVALCSGDMWGENRE